MSKIQNDVISAIEAAKQITESATAVHEDAIFRISTILIRREFDFLIQFLANETKYTFFDVTYEGKGPTLDAAVADYEKNMRAKLQLPKTDR